MHGISIEWNEDVVLSESKRIIIMRLAGFCGLGTYMDQRCYSRSAFSYRSIGMVDGLRH